ncbi:DUF2497 domain-containing protein [Sandaracinobacteroides sp. A072]|uniref:DUF2497 domain-containing protein n=1 Tax=Sandaracinobacteroides sp. A072 TaxID=3461146 RepID=UPI0040426A79
MSKPLDPNLASILESIRATVGGEAPPPSARAAQRPARPAEAPAESMADDAAADVEMPSAGTVDADPQDEAPESLSSAQPLTPAAITEALLARVAHAEHAALPVPGMQRTVEEFLAEMIRPHVQAWLKAHLPEIVQKMAAEEIARLTGRN